MRIYERFNGIVLLAGFGCYLSALSVVVIAPALRTVAADAVVRDVNGNLVKVPPYTPEQAAGKRVYEAQVCWHCHSQFVRPVNDEDKRWGPVSQAGESALDAPHLFSTRRIGPDLAREGGLRPDDWQYMHLWDPRAAVSESVMPGFTWLFTANPAAGEVQHLLDLYDYDGNGVIEPGLDGGLAPMPGDEVGKRIRGADRVGLLSSTYKQDDKGADLVPGADGKRPYANVYTQVADARGRPTEAGDGLLSDRDGAPLPGDEARNVVAYLQRLGTAIGPWRQPLAAPTPVRSVDRNNPPKRGVTVEWKDSAGQPQTSTLDDGLLPRRERTRRLYGEARTKASPERLAAARDAELEYAAVLAAWRQANPAWDERLTKGEALYVENCASCHGAEGRGNGVGARWLNPRPRDFTLGYFLYRSTQAGNLPLDGDLFRTLWRGLPGTAMPSWRELREDDLWLLVDWVQTFQETIGGERNKEFDDQAAALAIPSVPKVNAEKLDLLVKRGKAVFAAAKCSNCHGTEGRGDGPGWLTTKLASDGHIRPRDFRPRFEGDQPALRIRGGAYPQDLYRTIFTGLGVQMPSSIDDFRQGWRLAAEVNRLVQAGAPADQVEAAKKAARRVLIVPLHDDELVKDAGVVRGPDDAGDPAEFLDRLRATGDGQVGDDWALVFYVMDMLQVRNLIPLAK